MAAILGPVRYASANAAIRARLAQLLSPRQWQRLLTAADPDQFADRLGATPYAQVLSSVGNEHLEWTQLERALRAHLAQAARTPVKFLQGRPRALLEWRWRRFELDNLKILLRMIAAKLPARQIRRSLVPLGDGSSLPWDDLMGARSISVLVEKLDSDFPGTFYAGALGPALNRYRREGELFPLEISLDLAYYRHLLKLVDRLSGRDREEAERFMRALIDSQNLLWAFRYRINFGLSPEEILNYTLPRKLRANAAIMQEIAAGAPVVETVRQLWPARLLDLSQLAGLSQHEALAKLELIFQRYFYNLARTQINRYPFHLGVILAYDLLLESEGRDLVTSLEGQVAGWPQERIKKHLIGARG